MKTLNTLLLTISLLQIVNGQDWPSIKSSAHPFNAIPTEYEALSRQPLATLGWEDGVHISPDGLDLYCTYVPIDLLSFVLNGSFPNKFSSHYLRGAPTFGMDLVSNPIGEKEWLHADILYAHREDTSKGFEQWTLSKMARPFYSEGAPAPSIGKDEQTLDFMFFTSNESPENNTDIWWIKNTNRNPTGKGVPLPPPIKTGFNEDNPHVVRTDKSHLVLFFDSNNRPEGKGDLDLWYSESMDNGETWQTPTNVSSINTRSKENQPFLFYDSLSQHWQLYYSALAGDGKLGIFRASQKVNNEWNSWGTPELVIGAGNTAGVGEPTLTHKGDISFVVVYADKSNTSKYNHFDSDPWLLRKKSTASLIPTNAEEMILSLYPNPANSYCQISPNLQLEMIIVSDALGRKYYETTKHIIPLSAWPNGLYYAQIYLKSGSIIRQEIVKH